MSSVVRDGWTLFGGYGNPRRLRASEFDACIKTFANVTKALVAARFMPGPFGDALTGLARRHPPDTYTLNYMAGRLDDPRAGGRDD